MKSSTSDVEAIYPLSSMQQGMLFHSLYTPSSDLYFEQLLCGLHGDLDGEIMRQSWQRVLDRHAILRTAFVWKQREQPLQVVQRKASLPWQQLDWRGESPEEQAAHLEQWLEQDREQGLRLSKSPIMRLALIRLAEQDYKLVWTYHHILLDAWSVTLVFGEIFTCYEALRKNQEPQLAQPQPFEQYVAWLQQQDLVKADTFWRTILKDVAAPTPLVVDTPQQSPSQPQQSYAEAEIVLSPDERRTLETTARQHDLTLNTLVQGAWALLLSRYSGEPDVVFGVVMSGRSNQLSGIDSMVGLFINTLPLRVTVAAADTVLSLLKQIQQRQIELLDYEFTPLSRIQGLSEVPRDLPLFESIVVFENFPSYQPAPGDEGGVQSDKIEIIERTNYPLTLVIEPEQQLVLRLSYDCRRFAPATIQAMLGHLQTLLAGLAADPQQPIATLPLLTETERDQLLTFGNAQAQVAAMQRSVPAQIAEQATRTPEAIALVQGQERLSYRNLDQRATQLAHHLRSHGVASEIPVAVCLPRSLDLVVALLAIWKAGGAYLPLDPDYPAQRLQLLLDDSQARLVITDSEHQDRLPASDCLVLTLDTLADTLAALPTTPLDAPTEPEQLAYLIYTSGSTGTPKGVAVSHANLAALCAWHRDTCALQPSDQTTHLAGLGFDAAVWELWPTLCAGATLHLARPDDLASLPALQQWLQQAEINVAFLPTPLAELLLATSWSPPPTLRLLLVGGDRLHHAPPAAWTATLRNNYGPTEATVVATSGVVSPTNPDTPGATLPDIGLPLPYVRAYVLDERLEPVPLGVPGELYLGGAGVARGYWQQPALTAAQFLPEPFADAEPGSRMYRTGDWVRWLPDGTLDYQGRRDQQVKIRGVRIELAEITATLDAHSTIRQSAVVLREDGVEPQIVAYVVENKEQQNKEQSTAPLPSPTGCPLGVEWEGEPATVGQGKAERSEAGVRASGEGLRSFLRERLPEYMIPSAFVFLEALPLTPNGKLDRSALPAPETSRTSSTSYVAPRTQLEQTIAAIWRTVLKVDQVGIDDNFFDLGGDSLLMLRMRSELEAARLILSTTDMFKYSTISSMVKYLSADAETSDVDHGLIEQARSAKTLARRQRARRLNRNGQVEGEQSHD